LWPIKKVKLCSIFDHLLILNVKRGLINGGYFKGDSRAGSNLCEFSRVGAVTKGKKSERCDERTTTKHSLSLDPFLLFSTHIESLNDAMGARHTLLSQG